MEVEDRKLEESEALISKRVSKGASKYEGKSPLKCVSCNNIGYFSSRCLERALMHMPRKIC